MFASAMGQQTSSSPAALLTAVASTLQEFRKILSQYTDIPEENYAKFDVRDGGVSGESA
jgi:hypothetical protein